MPFSIYLLFLFFAFSLLFFLPEHFYAFILHTLHSLQWLNCKFQLVTQTDWSKLPFCTISTFKLDCTSFESSLLHTICTYILYTSFFYKKSLSLRVQTPSHANLFWHMTIDYISLKIKGKQANFNSGDWNIWQNFLWFILIHKSLYFLFNKNGISLNIRYINGKEKATC